MNLERLKELAGLNESVETPITEVAAPGEEEFVKKHKEEFQKRYGKRWKQVLYATAWKMHDKKTNESAKSDWEPEDEVKEPKDGIRVGKNATGSKEEKEFNDKHADKFKSTPAKKSDSGEWEVDESVADEIFNKIEELAQLAVLSGIVNEAADYNPEIETIKYANPPANLYQLKEVKVNDDYFEVKKELTGMDKNEEHKVKVPKAVNKAIDKRIEELKNSIEQFGGGGPQETALEQLIEFKRLLSSENLEDYQRAQVLFGTLWTEISERLPSLLVSFLHTGKELETSKVQ